MQHCSFLRDGLVSDDVYKEQTYILEYATIAYEYREEIISRQEKKKQ